MFITYDNKKHEKDILEKTSRAELKTVSGKGAKNKLIHADNLSTLKTLLGDYSGKVDLIYIDPPFATIAQTQSVVVMETQSHIAILLLEQSFWSFCARD